TKTLARWPPVAMTFSAMLVPLQAGSWLMSILAALGASPSSLTVPLTLATVAGSMGVAGAAAGAEAAGVSTGASSFFPHPVSRTNAKSAGIVQTDIRVFVFMLLL